MAREPFSHYDFVFIAFLTTPPSGHASSSSLHYSHSFLPATQGQRSKAVLPLMGASKAALRVRSREATVGGWLKCARQSASSDGMRISVI